MADFATLLAKVDQQAADHDAGTATQKCPKKRKPGIYVIVARADTDDAVQGVDVDVSRPTSKNKKTDGEGMSKFDDAKVGNHGVKFTLSSELAKKFVAPAPRSVATSAGRTSTMVLLLQPLPSLEVTVQQSGGSMGYLGGAVVEVSGPERFKQTTEHGTGVAKFAALKPGRYEVTVTLTKTHLEWAATPGVLKKVVVVGQANQLTVLVHPKGKVDPKLAIDDPKVVLVKRDYMSQASSKAKPHRLPVQLGVSAKFDGTGRLTCAAAAKIAVYKAATGGSALPFPISVTASELNQGLSGGAFTLYIEGVDASGGMDDVELELALQGGTGSLGPPAKDKLTCVRLKLDICKWRVDDTTDPVIIPEGDKITKGRYVHVQHTKTEKEYEQERAKLIVYKAEPASFTGKLALKVWDQDKGALGNRAELVPGETGAQTAHPNPYLLDNSAIPATGEVLWVQGKVASKEMLDTAIRLSVEHVADAGGNLAEGDRVTLTVFKTSLEIYQSRTKPDADPEPMKEEDQLKKGRYLHEQDSDGHHGRALILIKQVEPASFDGKLTLRVWDVTAKSESNPRAEVFEEEVPGTGQAAKANPYEIDHKTKVPSEGLKLWVQGKNGSVSAALIDTEIRLGVKDHMQRCARGMVTVVRFKNLKADIPSTPANINRAGNSPVQRHELSIAGGTANDFSEDFGVNLPLPLVEDSVSAGDPIKLSVEIEPAAANDVVSWAVTRDKTKNGDHSKIKDLKGNDDVTITPDGGDKLKATLLADNVGSFHVRPYIDCNGNSKYDDTDKTGKRIDREPYLLMNLILIRVQCVNNLSVANSAAGGPLQKDSTGVPTGFSTGDFAATGNDAVTMKANVRVVGGGKDGLRGLDMLFTGWVNNEANCPSSPGPGGLGEDVTHAFQKLAPPAGPVKRTRCYWENGGAEITGPVLDSGYAGQGTGGDSCTGTAGSNGSVVQKKKDSSGVGQKWEISNVDSPGGGILDVHPTDAAAQLINFKFNIDFRCDLVFWTNRDKDSGPSDKPASRLYSSVQSNTWNIRFESRFGAAYAETPVTPKRVTFNKDGNTTRRATPVAGSGLETRLPDGLNSLQADVPF